MTLSHTAAEAERRQGETQDAKADGERKKKKIKLDRNRDLKVISPVYRKAIVPCKIRLHCHDTTDVNPILTQ